VSSAASLLPVAAAAAAGYLAWGLVEYLVHGVLSPRFRTFVSPLHWGHHRDPRAVFTSPAAWAPAAALVFALLVPLAGAAGAAAALAGLLAGFARYEVAHWRIHFRAPRNRRERLLRCHHLAHHYRNPRAYHGVTTRLWDRVFGTLPDRWRDDYARVADRAPLAGPSNLRAGYAPAGLARELGRRLRHRPGRAASRAGRSR